MSLTIRIRNLSKPLALIAALAAAPVYSCGGDERDHFGGSSGCADDSDCKGDRICIDGRCEYEGGSSDDRCGNSPIYGKYLWEIGGCESAIHMKKNCKVDIYVSDDHRGVVDVLNDECDYFSMRLQCNGGMNGEFKRNVRYTNDETRLAELRNQLIDRYNALVLVCDDEPCTAEGRKKIGVWIPLDEQFTGHIDCAPRFNLNEI
jgi:hypothetical protein